MAKKVTNIQVKDTLIRTMHETPKKLHKIICVIQIKVVTLQRTLYKRRYEEDTIRHDGF